MEKFTQGKWEIGRKLSICVNPNYPLRTQTIAHVMGHPEDEEMIANAKLIAAAPEMYEALKEFIKIAEKHNDYWLQEYAEPIKQAKQILTKINQ